MSLRRPTDGAFVGIAFSDFPLEETRRTNSGWRRFARFWRCTVRGARTGDCTILLAGRLRHAGLRARTVELKIRS